MTIQGMKTDPVTVVSSVAAIATPSPVVAEKPIAEKKPERPVFAAPSPQRHAPTPDEFREIRAAVAARLEQYLADSGRNLEFTIDTQTHATVITVRRADTGEVVRQFPNEEALTMMRQLSEHSGTLLDLKA
jgi:flagellar protein FlaG